MKFGKTPWTNDLLVTGPLPTHRLTQYRTKTSMPGVRFEPKLSVFGIAKTFPATVIFQFLFLFYKLEVACMALAIHIQVFHDFRA
jgi:hypothetical protein